MPGLNVALGLVSPWYAHGLKLAGLVLVIACLVCLTNKARWGR